MIFQFVFSETSRFLLMVLDFSVPPNLVEIDEIIMSTATILHLDQRSAMLCILPQKYSGQTTKSNITANRHIEDAILKAGLNLEYEIGMQFTIDAMHGNDKRPLNARAKLCFSDKICNEDSSPSPWISSLAARGKMPDIPLMRIREMKRLCHPGHVGEAVEAYNLSPAERCQQKGSRAVLKIVEKLVADTDIASPDARLDICEMNVDMVPCWAEGALLMKQNWASDQSKPKVTYIGFCKEMGTVKTLETHMHAILMQEWWEAHPSAGPQEPTDSGPIDKPMLTLVSWSDSTPALPEMIVSKFDGDETYSSKWNAKVSSFRDFITNKVAPLIALPVGSTASPGQVNSMDGPDWTVGDKPAEVQDVLLAATATGDFPSDKVFPICISYISFVRNVEPTFLSKLKIPNKEFRAWTFKPCANHLPMEMICQEVSVQDTYSFRVLLPSKALHSEGNQGVANSVHHQGPLCFGGLGLDEDFFGYVYY